MNSREAVTIYEIIAANNLANEVLSSSNHALGVSAYIQFSQEITFSFKF
jgi:hypothetical protein